MADTKTYTLTEEGIWTAQAVSSGSYESSEISNAVNNITLTTPELSLGSSSKSLKISGIDDYTDTIVLKRNGSDYKRLYITRLSGEITTQVLINKPNKDIILLLDSVNIHDITEGVGIYCQSANSVTICLKENTTNTITGLNYGIQSNVRLSIYGNTNSTLNITNCEYGIYTTGNLDIRNLALNITNTSSTSVGINIPSDATLSEILYSNVNISVGMQSFKIDATSCINNIKYSTCNFNSTNSKNISSNSTLLTTLSYSTLTFNSINSAIDVIGDIVLNKCSGTITSSTKHAIKTLGSISIINSSNLNLITNAPFTEDSENGRFIYVPSDFTITDEWQFLENYLGQYIKIPNDDVSKYSSTFTLYTLDKSKGINAKEDINILDSTLNIHTNDDCLNTETNITVKRSTLTLWTCDDAICAIGNVTIGESGDNSVNITVNKSFEALEGYRLDIYSGTHTFKSYDDTIISYYDTEKISGVEPDICIYGGTIDAYSDRDDPIDMDGDLRITGGQVYCYGPYGMLSTRYDNTDYPNILISSNATFLYVAQPKSVEIPCLASSQNTLVADLKGINTIEKNKYLSIVKGTQSYTFKVPMTNNKILSTQYNETTQLYQLLEATGYQIILSNSFITDGTYNIYLSDTFSSNLLEVVNNYDFSNSTLLATTSSLSFANDTTQLYSTKIDCSEVSYQYSYSTTWVQDSKTITSAIFKRGLLQADGTLHAEGKFAKL